MIYEEDGRRSRMIWEMSEGVKWSFYSSVFLLFWGEDWEAEKRLFVIFKEDRVASSFH